MKQDWLVKTHPSSTTNEKYGLLPSHTKVRNITIQGPRSVMLGGLSGMQKYMSVYVRVCVGGGGGGTA